MPVFSLQQIHSWVCFRWVTNSALLSSNFKILLAGTRRKHEITGQDMLTYLSLTGPNLESLICLQMTCLLNDCSCAELNFLLPSAAFQKTASSLGLCLSPGNLSQVNNLEKLSPLLRFQKKIHWNCCHVYLKTHVSLVSPGFFFLLQIRCGSFMFFVPVTLLIHKNY